MKKYYESVNNVIPFRKMGKEKEREKSEKILSFVFCDDEEKNVALMVRGLSAETCLLLLQEAKEEILKLI